MSIDGQGIRSAAIARALNHEIQAKQRMFAPEARVRNPLAAPVFDTARIRHFRTRIRKPSEFGGPEFKESPHAPPGSR